MFILYCKTLLRWDTGKGRDWLSGMGRFKGWVNSVSA